ncbi:cytochrome P450 [Nocardia sp. NPDC060256]|uniref:cytochrome P450 n=1 Tax=unclassified Nocardia TaxID=2637762 RepID=UPI00364A864B
MKIAAGVEHDPVDLDTVDLFDAEFYATGDPHRVWAQMRAHAPLHRQVLADGRAFWSVTRYSDACRVLGDHREFTSERGSLLNQLGHGDAAAGKMLVATDPPRHGELRRPLHRMFTGRALAGSIERIRDAVRAVLAAAGDGGAWDLAQHAAMLPMAVAAGLMDLPESDWAQLVRLTGMAAAPEDPAFRVGSSGATLAIAHHELFEYFSRCHRDRAGTAGSDLIRHLMTMSVAGEALTREEVVFNCYSLLLGANATTPHTVSGTVLALMEHGDQYRAAADPSLIRSLVEEGLRWTSPANSFLRHTTSRVRLGDGWVDEGAAVVVWIGSANRDENVFHDPYRFDITRADNRHIAFGHGPHYCLGAALARLTLRVFFEEAIGLFEEIDMSGPPIHLRSNFIAGLTSLPVRTTRRSAAGSFTAG